MRVGRLSIEKEFVATTISSPGRGFRKRLDEVYRDIFAGYPDDVEVGLKHVKAEVFRGLSELPKLAVMYRWRVTLAGRTFFSGPRTA